MTKTYIKLGDTTVDAADVTVPTDRIFRDAWVATDVPVIAVDMTRARDIWREKIRLARGPVLRDLDAEFMKALECSADTTDVVARKKALRNAPADPAIATAQTPDELKAIHPAHLNVT